jgi:hypothetical protein
MILLILTCCFDFSKISSIDNLLLVLVLILFFFGWKMQNIFILRTLYQAQGVQGLDEDYKDTFQVNLALDYTRDIHIEIRKKTIKC